MNIPTRRLDSLETTFSPQRDHEVAAMRDGISNKLRVEQILALLLSSDIPDGAVATGKIENAAVTLAKLAADARAASGHTFDDTAAQLGETDVQGAIDVLAVRDVLKVKTTNQATTSSSFEDDSDLKIPVKNGESWVFEAKIAFNSAASTQLQIAMNGPLTSALSGNSVALRSDDTIGATQNVVAYNTVLASSNNASSDAGTMLVNVFATFTADGTFAIRLRRNAGTGDASIRSASILRGSKI